MQRPGPRPSRRRLSPRPTGLATAASLVGLTALLAAGLPVLPAQAANTAAHRAVSDPAQYVDPLVGSRPGGPDFGHGGGAGNTFPGADAPLGMVQWSPDTVTHQHGGYHYDDNRIYGFSLTHLSGPGCSDFGNVPFLPVPGDKPLAHATFKHENESASPGQYAVTFDNGVRTELAATQRSGMARLTYPAGARGSLSVDAAKAFNAARGSVAIGTDTLSGYTEGGGFCGAGNRYRLYFHVAFDRPFATSGMVKTDRTVDQTRRKGAGKGTGSVPAARAKTAGSAGNGPVRTAQTQAKTDPAVQAFVSFDTSSDQTVEARVGVSFVSAENARANLTAEQGGRTFDQVKSGTRTAWNELLSRISVQGGTEAQRRLLYTNLYHSLLHPNVLSDVNGEYPGFDGRVHQARTGHAQYANYSGWDVYRSQVQLLALLAPKEASDIAQSAVNQADQGGYFDRWTVANGGTNVMNGDPMSIIVSNMHAFGATDFDTDRALQRMVTGSRDTRQRPAAQRYDSTGYLPAKIGEGVWGSASTTLEYASADFAVSQFAARTGDRATAETYLRRAQNWRNLFEAGERWIKPRNADRSWPGFSLTQKDEYVEGNAAQYTWMVPHNYRGLFDAMGGNAAAVARLDTFFTELNAGPDKPYAYLGNEPTLNTPWAYAYAGAPYKTQDVVRRALNTVYKAGPDGYAGNDDLGQMASWGVWAALGMYPQAPGRAELVLASPRFPSTVITRGNGTKITVNAPGASDTNRYVHGLKVNGQASNRPWLAAELVRDGGTLDYQLADTPAPAWGSAPADAPPSFDVGPAAPRTGQLKGLAGKCADVDQANSADATKIQLWDCGPSAGQRWTLAADGTVRALGRCLDVANSGVDNGAKVQLYTCNGTGAQQWWPRAEGTLVSPASGRCLDVPGSNTANGTQLQLFDCNRTGAQLWRLS